MHDKKSGGVKSVCFFSECADACWVNILNVRVSAYPNYFNLLNSCCDFKHSQSGKWVCLVDLNLSPLPPPPPHDTVEYSLILSFAKRSIPPSSTPRTKDFKYVRMSLDALIPLWLPATSSAEAIET